jgi:hypothetical protein
MKIQKIIIILLIAGLFLSSTVSGIDIKNDAERKQIYENWTGSIRIEGESSTIWNGTVDFDSSIIEAENMETHEIETHIIQYPSALGAIDEASKIGGFDYTVVYYPSFDSLFVTAIGNDISDFYSGWVYFVDYTSPLIGAGEFELSDENEEIIWGFLYFDNWYTTSHALKISVDKKTIMKNEEFTVIIKNESNYPVEGAKVFIGSDNYSTNSKGEVTTSLSSVGTYKIYSEKESTIDDTYVRTEKIDLIVKKARFKSHMSIQGSISENYFLVKIFSLIFY